MTANLWELNIAVYRLRDVPRTWYISVKDVLQFAEAAKRLFDNSLFF